MTPTPLLPRVGDTITTVEQLEALPVGTVVLFTEQWDPHWGHIPATAAQKLVNENRTHADDPEVLWFVVTGDIEGVESTQLTAAVPATVLHLPKASTAPESGQGWVPTDEEVVAAFKRGADELRGGDYQYQTDLEAAVRRWIDRHQQAGTPLVLPDREELAKTICESRWKVTAGEWRWHRISAAQRRSWLETADKVLSLLRATLARGPEVDTADVAGRS